MSTLTPTPDSNQVNKSVFRKAYSQMMTDNKGNPRDITIQDFIEGWVNPIFSYGSQNIPHRSDAIEEVLTEPKKKPA